MPSWGNAKVPDNSKTPRLDELIDLVDLPDKQYVQLRPVGPIAVFAEHWFDIRKRDGGKASLRKTCLNFDQQTGEFDDSRGCPYCAAGMRAERRFLGNVIVRDLQANEPRNPPAHRTAEQQMNLLGPKGDPESIKCFFKQKDSKSWTPVRVLKATTTLARALQGLTSINKHGGEPKQLSDLKFGRDVMVMYDKNAAGAAKYQATFGNQPPGPLSNTERRYLLWNIFGIMEPETLEAAEKDWERLAPKYIPRTKDGEGGDDATGEDGYYNDQPQARGRGRPATHPARGRGNANADADDDLPWNDEGDDLEETTAVAVPSRRTAAAPSGRVATRPAVKAGPTVGQITTIRAHGKVKVLAVSNDGSKVKVLKASDRSEVVVPVTAFAA